jgi:hypothetical protein
MGMAESSVFAFIRSVAGHATVARILPAKPWASALFFAICAFLEAICPNHKDD